MIFGYLTVARHIAPGEIGSEFVAKDEDFRALFPEETMTAILTDTYISGSFIKTYFIKLRVLLPTKVNYDYIIRVSRDLYKKHEHNIGMSLFSRIQKFDSEAKEEQITDIIHATIPGYIFINDANYGRWIKKRNKIRWIFHPSFKSYYQLLGWGNYRPSMETYLKFQHSIENKIVFYGPNHEFGSHGMLSQKYILENRPPYSRKRTPATDIIKIYIAKTIALPNSSLFQGKNVHE